VAAAGKPVYVEKPMALDHGECQQMIAACSTAGVPLFVAYYRRALPRFLRIKALLDSGAIGEVRAVSVELFQTVRPQYTDPDRLPWRVRPAISGGGLFLDVAVHTLDFLDYALGPIADAVGFAANQGKRYPADDIVSGVFRFASGVQGVGAWCFTSFEERDRTVIRGTLGSLAFATFGESPVEIDTAEGPRLIAIANPRHIQQPLIQTIVDALNGVGECPSTGESGARTTWVADQLLRSFREKS
jgi:1,5-anhydro-D-fructose reductase (1,5-anhydro-D-mannitol-forming)